MKSDHANPRAGVVSVGAKAPSQGGAIRTITVSSGVLCITALSGYVGWRIARAYAPLALRAVRDRLRNLLSGYLRSKDHKHGQSEIWRDQFRETPDPHTSERNPTHTHPVSASWRSSAATFARLLTNRVGAGLFSYQMSNADQRNGIRGNRAYYWHKDASVRPDGGQPSERDLVLMVDVDYYTDLPEILLEHENPVLLYTFQPTEVTCATGEFSFRFREDNQVVYSVSGGASYNHRVWQYGKDTLTVSGFAKNKSWCVTKTYLVERRKTNPHHEYVLLVPMSLWYGIPAMLSWFLLEGNELCHLEVNHGQFNVLDQQLQNGRTRSIARVGDYNCATVKQTVFDALSVVARTNSVKIGLATVLSWIDNDRVAATVLLDYFLSKADAHPMTIYPAENGIRTYQLMERKEQFDPEAKGLMKPFMSPILPATFVPTATSSNEERAVKGRVLETQDEAKKLVEAENGTQRPTQFLLNQMEKFAAFVFKDMKQPLIPAEIETVYARQPRPTQQSILQRAEAKTSKDACESFMKAEPYQDLKDPRLITTYDGVSKREYARVIYPLADYVVAHCDWYSFGKTPLEIAERIVYICQLSTLGINMADAARMDGHVTAIARELERVLLKAAFAPDYWAFALEQHSKQCHLRVYGKLGTNYDIEDQRGSGSAETALFNSFLTKFNDYLGRVLYGVDEEEAYYAPMCAAGDDSIACQFSRTCIGGTYIERAGRMVGQKIENVEAKRGEAGVNYLSRFYTEEVWFGNAASTCDLPRALAKIHVTVAMPLEPIEKLVQKLTGLWYTDRNTPVIKQILETGLRLGLSYSSKPDPALAGWWAQYSSETNWPSAVIEDHQAFVTKLVPNANFDALLTYLTNTTVVTQLLTMPLIDIPASTPPTVKVLTAVDDDIKKPQDKTPDSTSSNPQPTIAILPKPAGLRKPVRGRSKEVCEQYISNSCDGKTCGKTHVKVCRDFRSTKGCQRVGCKFPHM